MRNWFTQGKLPLVDYFKLSRVCAAHSHLSNLYPQLPLKSAILGEWKHHIPKFVEDFFESINFLLKVPELCIETVGFSTQLPVCLHEGSDMFKT